MHSTCSMALPPFPPFPSTFPPHFGVAAAAAGMGMFRSGGSRGGIHNVTGHMRGAGGVPMNRGYDNGIKIRKRLSVLSDNLMPLLFPPTGFYGGGGWGAWGGEPAWNHQQHRNGGGGAWMSPAAGHDSWIGGGGGGGSRSYSYSSGWGNHAGGSANANGGGHHYGNGGNNTNSRHHSNSNRGKLKA